MMQVPRGCGKAGNSDVCLQSADIKGPSKSSDGKRYMVMCLSFLLLWGTEHSIERGKRDKG